MKGWKGCVLALLGVLVLGGSGAMAESVSERRHVVYFEGTDYELNVYRIDGKHPGKTLMLIGGIQGDEPGGFLSADLYADMTLEKGGLIVVPRANLLSIIANRRQINQDMNRTFSDETPRIYEAKVVEILKSLIRESDALLNLHDGSGFYSPTWESDTRNPKRFGQSIIADTARFTKQDGTVLELGAMAERVVAEINRQVADKKLKFRFNNHRTRQEDSIHKEQRSSATYYALIKCEIPAFGIETSKSLSLEQKVRHHNYAINAFMREFGVVPETPGVRLRQPTLDHLVVRINELPPFAVRKGETLRVPKGARLTIERIVANYERGLTADILGAGRRNDLNRTVTIAEPTRIVVKKDSLPCGTVKVVVGALPENGGVRAESAASGSYLFFKVKVGAEERLVPNYGRLRIPMGERLTLVDVETGICDPADLVVNFKGYVGDRSWNTGEDRGYAIDTSRELMARFSTGKKGVAYPVEARLEDALVGQMVVELVRPEAALFLYETEAGDRGWLRSGETLHLSPDSRVRLTTMAQDGSLSLSGAGKRRRIRADRWVALSDWVAAAEASGLVLDMKRKGVLAGSIRIQLEKRNAE